VTSSIIAHWLAWYRDCAATFTQACTCMCLLERWKTTSYLAW